MTQTKKIVWLTMVQSCPSPDVTYLSKLGIKVDYLYWLGTDSLGRDIVTRLIFGARASLLVGLIAPMIAMVIGGSLGLLAGFYRGRFETVVVALMDIILAFPGCISAKRVFQRTGFPW